MVRRRCNATTPINATLGSFTASIERWVLLAVVCVAVLGILGIEATSLASRDLNLLFTELATADTVQIIVPKGQA